MHGKRIFDCIGILGSNHRYEQGQLSAVRDRGQEPPNLDIAAPVETARLQGSDAVRRLVADESRRDTESIPRKVIRGERWTIPFARPALECGEPRQRLLLVPVARRLLADKHRKRVTSGHDRSRVLRPRQASFENA